MSLDVKLYKVYGPGVIVAIEETLVYSGNITHNLGIMAKQAGVYECLWRPDEHEITKAGQIIPILAEGVRRLEADPEYFKKFDSPNGWGKYVHFVPFCKNYLEACRENPEARVKVSR